MSSGAAPSSASSATSLPAHIQIVANDDRGLTLGHSKGGNVFATTATTNPLETTSTNAGVYTSLVHLASQLSIVTGGGGTSGSGTTTSSSRTPTPHTGTTSDVANNTKTTTATTSTTTGASGTSSGSDATAAAAATTTTSTPASTMSSPLITLETAEYAILVKDYDGYAVAVQVPKKASTTTSMDGGVDGGTTTTATIATTIDEANP